MNLLIGDSTAEKIDQEVKRIIDNAYNRTKKLLTDKKEELEKIANKLLEKEILFQNDLEKLIGKRPFKTNLELSLEEESTQESKKEIKNENELDGKNSNQTKE